MAFFVLALLLTIGLSLALYSQARQDLINERLKRVELEASLLSTLLGANQVDRPEVLLLDFLHRIGFEGAAALFSENGELIAKVSTIDHAPEIKSYSLSPTPDRDGSTANRYSSPPTASRQENGTDIVETSVAGGRVLVLARRSDDDTSPVIFYVASYQIVALVLAIGLVLLMIRWLLRPYHRMVEAARGSPVLATSTMSEGEFVVETFQALIEQLHDKEQELERLHALERNRADRSEKFSERLVANIPSGLVAIDARGLVTSVNMQASEIFGVTSVLGVRYNKETGSGALRSLSVDYHAFFRAAPRMIEMISQCLDEGTSFRRGEAEITDPDGRIRHLGLSISPIAYGQQSVEGALCLMTDLTEVIELRERMKAQENLANLGEMAAGLAHEFKNSLATIQGYVQLIQAQTVSDQSVAVSTRTLDATLNEVRLLGRLVTDFLNFAKPQQLNLDQVSLEEIIRESVAETLPILEEAGIKLRLTGEFASIPGDESLLRRAFVNLVRNAAEAIDTQSADKLIEISGSTDKGIGRRFAHIRVSDTGSGISPQDLTRIFIPFYTTKSRGYGIGLAIVQKVFIAHGGSVSIERSDGNGTIFSCKLPLSHIQNTVEVQ